LVKDIYSVIDQALRIPGFGKARNVQAKPEIQQSSIATTYLWRGVVY
jgi:hypothetical protein